MPAVPRESYVSPVLTGREPAPAWVAVWRFRAVLLLVLAALAFSVVTVIRASSGSFRNNDPSFQSPGGDGSDVGPSDLPPVPGAQLPSALPN